MTAALTYGQIVSAVVAAPHLDVSLAGYQDVLGLRQVDNAALGAGLAVAWDAPALAGARTATLQAASGAPCYVRLVEQPLSVGFQSTTTFGWNAYELTVQDVFRWPAKLAGSAIRWVLRNMRAETKAPA